MESTKNREVYVTDESLEAAALSARLTIAGIENQIEARIGKGQKPYWVNVIEFPQDLKSARAERELYLQEEFGFKPMYLRQRLNTVYMPCREHYEQ